MWKCYVHIVLALIVFWSCTADVQEADTTANTELSCRDIDQDEICDDDDDDRDGDSVLDIDDSFPDDPRRCADADGDGCDDCALLGQPDPNQDGQDFDEDGMCDFGDDDIDNDGVSNLEDQDNNDALKCYDLDEDGCDDCTSGIPNAMADGDDLDEDGLCDLGDPDIDNDGILNENDGLPRDANGCGDTDRDGCDDCRYGAPDPSQDGDDLDEDGLCDVGDRDRDGDGVDNDDDTSPEDSSICSDLDEDGCDDCSQSTFNTQNDGDDLDEDGICDLGDLDIDGDGVDNELDLDPMNATVCSDLDEDGCDDCTLGTQDVAQDGDDLDTDGICNAGDTDADGDGVDRDIDCDDLNILVSPNTQEACDEIDNDCDGNIDEFARTVDQTYVLYGSGELYWEFNQDVAWYHGNHGFSNTARGTIFHVTEGVHELHFDGQARLVGIKSDFDADDQFEYAWVAAYNELGQWSDLTHIWYQADTDVVAHFMWSYEENERLRMLDIDGDMQADSMQTSILSNDKVQMIQIDQDADGSEDARITYVYDQESRLVEKWTDFDLNNEYNQKVMYEYSPVGELVWYYIFEDEDEDIDAKIQLVYDGAGQFIEYVYDMDADNVADMIQTAWMSDQMMGSGWQFDYNADDVLDAQVFYRRDFTEAVIEIMTDTGADGVYESIWQNDAVCEEVGEDMGGETP